MFYHIKELQYRAKPSCPDPAYAKKLQEVLGGQYGEISVMMQYLFQGFNCRADEKYRDLLHDVGTEEIGHVEMLATMISRLLDDAPADVQENAYKSDPAVAAVMGGMNPQHAIVAGLGAMAADAEGYPWNAKYIISSGNLLADFRANLNAESQGRLQVTRLYAMTDDPGVRDMLSFLIARDTYHQNMWYAAIKELEERERDIVVPATFPRELEKQEVSYDLFNFSRGDESSQGRWARGEAFDGRGEFRYISVPVAFASAPHLKPAPMWLHNTLLPMSKC
ncbi:MULTISPECIES: manganese catalase family protein [Bacillus]|uniref:Manganese catalase family protein n=1 Tax=Bacillus amyloliquefaciens TaxID=1390 RepID=A0AAP4DIA0_BACAM|nr:MULTISPECIES: manganese catalase family protein [Bacillus]SLB33167.1 catalase [Mycobacteroides abscessus subsp. massiliense]ATU26370.1 manganese catalase [Bacillus velezensis]ATY27889.1 manganese catalase [Bacillus velezensis]AUS16630.1 manganese catalase [Bacillus velezensis]AWM43743.1 manganese catalase [Bacillus amyloliquefaciens]